MNATRPAPAEPAPAARVAWRRVLGASLLMSLALAFNAGFTLLTLDGIYGAEAISRFRMSAERLRRDLQTEARYHRRLAEVEGIARKVETTRHRLAGLGAPGAAAVPGGGVDAGVRVVVAAVDGRVLGRTGGVRSGWRADDILARGRILLEHGKPTPGDAATFQARGLHYVVLPVRGLRQQWLGAVVLELDPHMIDDGGRFLREIGWVLALTVLGGAALLVYLFAWQGGVLPGRPALARGASVGAIFAVLVLTQIISSALAVAAFRHEFVNLSVHKAQTALAVLRQDLEPVVRAGVPLRFLADLQPSLDDLIARNPAIARLTLEGTDGAILAAAQATRPGAAGAAVSFGAGLASLTADLHPGGGVPVQAVLRSRGEPRAVLTATVARQSVDARMWEIATQGVTLLVVALLFAGELLVLARQYMTRGGARVERGDEDYRAMRPAIFFFMFGIDISMSFVPLQMRRLYEPVPGLAEDFILGLPVSAEFLCVGVALLWAGIWLDRRGWHEPFLAGLLMAGLGVLYSAVAPGPMHFVIARGVVGVGYGLTFMAAQGHVIARTRPAERTQGLAHLFAGLYAGSLCGGTVGAMLADRFGFETVFLSGAVVLVGVFLYGLTVMRGGRAGDLAPVPGANPAPAAGPAPLARFLGDRGFVAVMLFSSLPAAVAVVGLINYYLPLQLDRAGASQTTIGQVLLIYGVCMVVLGPRVGRVADGFADKRMPILLGGVLGAVALLAFALLDGLTAAVAAMLLLGVSSCFVLPSQSAYVLALPVTRALGKNTAVGIFRATSRVGQTIGPMVFAGVVAAAGAGQGVAWLGVAYGAAVLLFALGSPTGRPRRQPAVGNADAVHAGG